MDLSSNISCTLLPFPCLGNQQKRAIIYDSFLFALNFDLKCAQLVSSKLPNR